MSKKTKTNLAITEAAQSAAGALSAWGAIEARAKSILAATEAQEATGSGNYAEFLFSGANVRAVIKAGECIVKIDN